MPVMVLIAQPYSNALTSDRLYRAMEVFGGHSLRWLEDTQAAEFVVDQHPKDITHCWSELQDRHIDLAVVLEEGRKKAILIADMDSTMIGQECIDELADEAGAGAEVAEVTARAMNGELDFEEAIDARVAKLAGLDTAVIARVLEDRITLASGGPTLLATMKAHGAYTALVSGGFTQFTDAIAAKLGFDEHRANTLEMADGKLAGTVKRPILGQQAKLDALHEISAERGVSAQDVLAVGDGANDLAMINAAGMGVALHAKPSVQAQAQIQINFGDLTSLLFLQGYTRAEFVTP